MFIKYLPQNTSNLTLPCGHTTVTEGEPIGCIGDRLCSPTTTCKKLSESL